MTCIAAIKKDGKVYIGGDSAGVAGLSIVTRADEKVFKNGPFIFGFTSSFRMGSLLRYKFDPPKQTIKQNDVEYMNTGFVDAVRECLKDGGYATVNNNVESGGVFIVGYKGNIYEIQSDYQIKRPLDSFVAVGCGGDLARGSLFTTKDMKLTPKKRLLYALNAAQSGSAGVREPFNFVSV